MHFANYASLNFAFSRKRQEDLGDPTIYPLINQLNGYIEKIYTVAGVFDRVERQFAFFFSESHTKRTTNIEFLMIDRYYTCLRKARENSLSLSRSIFLSFSLQAHVCTSFASRGDSLRHKILNNKFDAPA